MDRSPAPSYAAHVSVKGPAAVELLNFVLAQVRPWMPDDVDVDVKRRWLVSRGPDNDGDGWYLRGSRIGRLGGTWSPWLPRRVDLRVTAHEAVEQVLEAVAGIDVPCTVKTAIDGDTVAVTFERVGALGSGRAQIRIPSSMCT